jgi:hypothetical protein
MQNSDEIHIMSNLIQGNLDVCNSEGIFGWAWCPTDPLSKVKVLCTIDGQVIACQPADQFRADLQLAGIGGGTYAFSIKIPTIFYDGSTHSVKLQASHGDTQFELAGSPIEITLSPNHLIIGDFSLGNDGLLQGWVVDTATPSRDVCVHVVAKDIGTFFLSANTYRNDLLELGNGTGRHGFQLVLPRDWYGHPELCIEVRETKTGKRLGNKTEIFKTDLSYFKLSEILDDSPALDIDSTMSTTISIILPVYNPDPCFLEAAIQSVKSQSYPFWQLCIADDASTNPEIRKVLESHAFIDDRIQIILRKENGHISEASNSALKMACGEFFALLDHDDLLHADALLEVAKVISNHPDVGIIFTDEDKCDEHGTRYGPYFKKGWDPELLLGQNCISHLGVYRTSLINQIGGFRTGFEGSQDYDLALRATRSLRKDQIQHIARPLYHWRAIPGSTALANSEKSYAIVAMHKALNSHLHAIGAEASCEPAVRGAYCRVRWPIPSPLPSITLAVPLAEFCASTAAFIEKTLAMNWPGIQVMTCHKDSNPVDNIESHRLTYLQTMVDASRGEIFIWLEEALPVEDLQEWFNELVSQALRADVGIVGTKILDETHHVIHAGFTYQNPSDETRYTALYNGLHATDPGQGGAAGLCRSVQAISSHVFASRRTTLSMLLADPQAIQDAPIMTELSRRAEQRRLRTLVTPFATTIFTPSYKNSFDK